MPDLEPWQSLLLGIGGLLGTIATAVATFFLWRVTLVLARETTRMAEASAQPHVVVTLSPNRWSVRHFDLLIDNTGNATAYDVKVSFNPPLQNGEARGVNAKIPFESVSVLKPGVGLRSYLSDYAPLKGKVFEVEISWRRSSSNKKREGHFYILSMSDHEGVSRLGNEPAIDVVRHLKGMEKNLADLSREHLTVDVYSALDRAHEKRQMAREQRRRRHSKNQQVETQQVLDKISDSD
ncbi:MULTISPECIES: hypothetical protein [unclassified Pseudomonas]|uniref:hypothetical protein n=1 Tax=unclassified Pseudomonas TaxID=196821 RepID=UPI000CD210AD|nr:MULTISPECIES: hypothetical protein [unclassified Pseudomonas]POA13260.1 hypothetical protein C1892_16775 [Pseudomonas sp. MPBD7-1]